MDEGFCYLENNNKNTKSKDFFKWGFEISHQDLQQKNRFQICINRLFQVLLWESKPSDEDVTPSSSSQISSGSFHSSLGWSGFVLHRGEVSEDQIAWQRSTKSQSIIFSVHLKGPLQSTDWSVPWQDCHSSGWYFSVWIIWTSVICCFFLTRPPCNWFSEHCHRCCCSPSLLGLGPLKRTLGQTRTTHRWNSFQFPLVSDYHLPSGMGSRAYLSCTWRHILLIQTTYCTLNRKATDLFDCCIFSPSE